MKLATDVAEDRKVAVKIYEKFKLYDPQKKKNLQREISILQKLNHPHIIRLFTTLETNRTVGVTKLLYF